MLELLKSLADPTRLRLLAILAQAELPVQDLTEILVMGQSRISRHLKILTEAGLLQLRREGTWSYYRLDPLTDLGRTLWAGVRDELSLLPDSAEDMRRLSQLCDRRRRQNREFFNRHAGQWNVLSDMVLPTADYLDVLLANIPVDSGTLLDLGTGTGRLLPQLAGRADAVVAVDHSPAMLEQAHQLLAQTSTRNVELRLGELTHLPVADAAADTVLLNMVLHHAQRPQEVLQEVARVTAPSGRLLIAELARHDFDWVRDALADVWLGFDAEDLVGWLGEAGFEVTRSQRITNGKKQAVLIMTAQRRS